MQEPPKQKSDPITWRRGAPPLPTMTDKLCDAAVGHGDTAYFPQSKIVYSYTLSTNKWVELLPCGCEDFSLAIVNNRLTMLGGTDDVVYYETPHCLSSDNKWEQCLSPLPTVRMKPVVATTPTHLVLAGGSALGVDILDLGTLKWASTRNLPAALNKRLLHLSVTFCDQHLYISEGSTVFSCSMEMLLKACDSATDTSSLWTRLADVPFQHDYGTMSDFSRTTLGGHVLAIGGLNEIYTGASTTVPIHCYDRNTNSWRVVGKSPILRQCAAIQSSNELVVLDAYGYDTYIGKLTL